MVMGKRTRHAKSPGAHACAATSSAGVSLGKRARDHAGIFLAAACLVVLVAAVFAPLGHADFITFDDPIYVSENPHVTAGLTWPGVVWAFTTERAANWHPLTWLSHMLDVQLFGVASGPQHMVNVVLHALNAVLLLVALAWMTGRLWPSALVAALFAVHPLHVESVAWIAERKDVLSTFFWMLTLLTYAAYVKARGRRGKAAWYALVVACLALGLMAKPMLVTLPFALLLLDVWPLKRLHAAGQSARGRLAAVRPLLLEKLPLFLLVAASSVVTVVAQAHGGAVSSLAADPFGLRLENAVVSFTQYLAGTFWPAGLAIIYPMPHALAAWPVAAAVCALVAISVPVVASAGRAPYLLVGWLWYLGTLLPVSGLVQVGAQARADRYTYVPLIGIFIMVAFGLSALAANRRRLLVPCAVLAVVGCAWVARGQVDTWMHDETVWRRALEVTPDNPIAHNCLGKLLYKQGRLTEAAPHITEAVRLAPSYYDAHHSLAMLYAAQGRADQAIAEWREEVRLNPTAEGLTALAGALMQKGDVSEAIADGFEAVKLDPEVPEAQYNLGLMLLTAGRLDEAVPHFRAACRLRPDLAQAHAGLAAALAQGGDLNGAVAEYAEAVRLNPTFETARYHYGLTLAAAGRFGEAAEQLSAVLRADPANADARRALDAVTRGR